MPIIPHANQIPADAGSRLWRYMDLSKFESLLSNAALFFCRADKFSDPFEGSLPLREAEHRDNYQARLGPNLSAEVHKVQQANNEGLKDLHQREKKAFVINCWHMNDNESDAMWRLYLKSNEGVAIASTVGQLESSLSDSPHRIGTSRVRYLNYTKDVWYHAHDYPHYGYNTLIPLIHKRKEFEHEKEFRLYHQVPNIHQDSDYWDKQPNNIGLLIPVKLPDLITEIILPPTADDAVERKVADLLNKYGYAFPVRKSALNEEPVY